MTTRTVRTSFIAAFIASWGAGILLTVAGQLTWLALTGLPTLATPIIAQARGHEAEWTVTGPIGLVVLVRVAALIW